MSRIVRNSLFICSNHIQVVYSHCYKPLSDKPHILYYKPYLWAIRNFQISSEEIKYMPNPLDPSLIPKYKNQLAIPPIYEPTVVKDSSTCEVESHDYRVTISQFSQQVLPEEFPETTVWGYKSTVRDPVTGKIIPDYQSTPGPTFEAKRHVPINVKWMNNLTGSELLAVDPTIHWANPNNMEMPMPPFLPFPPGYPEAQSPIPIVTHLHGGETEPASDGYPEAWFTACEEITGPEYIKSRYHYSNEQEPTTLWYHDHTLGLTRLNVYMGLAGFYILRDPEKPLDGKHSELPRGKYEIPLVIQDRSFNDDGSLSFPSDGINPEVHPYWNPGFLGDTIMVNGRVWPNLNVEPRQYRFRILNGSNERFYNLSLSNQMAFFQIGTDGGYLPKPAQLVSLLISPGERADILVDFSKLTPGTKLILNNTANAPYPNGTAPDPQTTGQIMQFTVLQKPAVPPAPLPEKLNVLTPLRCVNKVRTLPLIAVVDATGLTELILNGQNWNAPVSEPPLVGSTEDWQLVNLTGGAHPIHLHLIQFRLVSRQNFLSTQYTADWLALNGQPSFDHPTKVLPVEPYLLNGPINPPANENGWKDTIQAYPGQVTTIRVRFAPQDVEVSKPGVNLFPFNPADRPGYVWHCHILDHEDNEMMRPYKVLNPDDEPEEED
jgi:spore coat protein A